MGQTAAVRTPETRYVAVGDAEIAYQVLGGGPVDLVFNHGLCHVDLAWAVEQEAAFYRKLASFSRLIRFDRRGSGASTHLPLGGFPTWEEWNRDLLAVLDAVGSDQAALFVEQEAGPMGMLFAATHPERVSGLILANASACAHAIEDDDHPTGWDDDQIADFVEVVRAQWGTTGMLEYSFPDLAESGVDLEPLARLIRGAATPNVAAAQYHHILGEIDAREALPLIHTPTLVLHNGGSGKGAAARYLAEQIEGARLVEVPGRDAMLFTGDQGPVIDAVSELLTGRRPEVEVDRILTTVLFTDIVRSTELAAEMGDRRWRELLDTHDRMVRDRLRQYRGQEINTTGDGFVASFDGPARAVRCAAEIVHAACGLGFEVRAGLHTGECERRGDDIAGMAVHVAARVAALAGDSEVMVSRTVTELVAGSGIGFEDRGEHTLKGVPGAWQLFAAAV